MPSEQNEKLREIFLAARELSPELRDHYLKTACARDEALLKDVAGLLANDATKDFAPLMQMAMPSISQADQPFAQQLSPSDRSMPAAIGPYRLLEIIGSGGMGVVYKAEQREPIRRIVAVKVIKLGFDSAEVIARFESERQALARMDHPNIAKVLDAGTDERGRPYFVMEYVPGTALTRFADGNKLSVRDRLELFINVCDAIAHAHSKAIIHRDIKSSNVLAFIADGKPAVKVIDFGIAKAVTGDRLTDRTFFTQMGHAIGTYESMSPEQADASPDIDTRTDVYSLGVLLYELLTGSTPFGKQMLGKAVDEELRRIIREEAPPRPSTRLSGLGEAGNTIAAARQLQLAALTRELRSELEWIPLKALRKERDRRYASPIQLADDIRNYIEGRPLIAAPDSRRYRVAKFVRRNKGPVVVSVIMLLAIFIAVIGLAVGQSRARAALAQKQAALLKEQTALSSEQAALNVAEQRREEVERQNAAAHARAAVLAEERGNWSTALDEYRAADAAHFPDRLAMVAGELRSLDRLNRTGEANALIAQVQRTMPDMAHSPQFLVVKGFFLWASKPRESESLIRQALQHADLLSKADQAFAEALVTDDVKVAAVKLREVVLNDHFHRDAWILLSIADLILGDAKSCELDALMLQELFPGDEAGAILGAMAAAFQSQPAEASAYLNRDLNLPPEVKSTLADALGAIGQLRSIDDMQKLNPATGVQLYLRVLACSSAISGPKPLPIPLTFSKIAGRFSLMTLLTEGDQFWRNNLSIFPNALGEYMAGIFAVPKDYPGAIRHMENAIAMPSLIDCRRDAAAAIVIFRLVSADRSHPAGKAEIDQTRKDLDQLITLGGIRTDVQVGEYYVLTMAYRDKLYEQTRRLAAMLLERFPDDAEAMYFLAWADSHLGQKDLAVALYTQALLGKGLPGDIVADIHAQLKELTAPAATQPILPH